MVECILLKRLASTTTTGRSPSNKAMSSDGWVAWSLVSLNSKYTRQPVPAAAESTVEFTSQHIAHRSDLYGPFGAAVSAVRRLCIVPIELTHSGSC